MKWISTEDELPKEYEHVLVNVQNEKNIVTIGRRIDGKSFQLGRFSREVDYWMPLPKPPNQ